MSVPAGAAHDEDALQREWWLRLPAVLLSPRPVFAALRDDSDAAAQARQEPIAAVVILAGVAGVLWTPVARQLLNDPSFSGVVVPIWAFLGGGAYGIALYWLLGGLLYFAARRLGGLGSYRRARHVLGLSAVPLALSLLTLWPVRIAVYGSDLFRSGGSDRSSGDAAFGGANLAFLAWSIALLVIGVRSVHGWSWRRAVAAVALAAVFPALIVLATAV
ncbi:MAG TPA: YIP1 family protein [Gaiellaceae bacterium]